MTSNLPHTRTAPLKPSSDCGATSANPIQIYMDTSALVKLVVAEDESLSLRSFLRQQAEDSLFTAALARTEPLRAVAPNGAQAVVDGRNFSAAWTVQHAEFVRGDDLLVDSGH